MRGKGQRGRSNSLLRERTELSGHDFTYLLFFILSSLCTHLALCGITHSPSLCDTQSLSLFFLTHPLHLQKLLFSLGGSFLYYADHFKLYSGFCANHIKVQKVLERGTYMTHTYMNEEYMTA